MLIFSQSRLLGIRPEKRLYIVQQFFDVDLVGRKVDLASVAEAVLDRSPAAGGLRHGRLEAAPVADDLVKPLLPLLAPGSLGIVFQESSPILGRLGVLPPVLEDFGQVLQCVQPVCGILR